jgi:iron complex transport system ATP-binding protein
VLRASKVSYTYATSASRSSVPAVHDVSLEIAPRSFTGLIGPNGCGKTTLLKLLSGLLRPGSGEITLHGRSLSALSRRATARQIALVPQETHPAFDFTCLEMVLMGRHPHLGAFQIEGPQDVAIAHTALSSTGTLPFANRLYGTLSGGEKQRVVIAMALAQEGDVMLLDEPTASLDLGYQLEVAALLRRLNRQRAVTMVLATHDLNLAASLCDTMALMREGRIMAHGPTHEVLTQSTVRSLYDVDAEVAFHDRAGHLTVIPYGRAQ